MKNIWLDGVMGVAVGDALGLPVQFMRREDLKKNTVTGMRPCTPFDSHIGTLSDDTAMTAAMVESIKRLGVVDAEDIMKNFVKWHDNGSFSANDVCIDEGVTCGSAIENYKKSGDILTCGKTGEYANGNGSLMRTLPVCLYYAEKLRTVAVTFRGMVRKKAVLEEAVDKIHEVSALTHNHWRAKIACGYYFFMVLSVLYGEGDLNTRIESGLNQAKRYYIRRFILMVDRPKMLELEEHLQLTKELFDHFALIDLNEIAERDEGQIKSSGYVVDSFWASVWALVTTTNYRDAMLAAVNLGDDTDTIAAIAGGLAGLYYGYNSIPVEWLEVLRKREWLEQLVNY